MFHATFRLTSGAPPHSPINANYHGRAPHHASMQTFTQTFYAHACRRSYHDNSYIEKFRSNIKKQNNIHMILGEIFRTNAHATIIRVTILCATSLLRTFTYCATEACRYCELSRIANFRNTQSSPRKFPRKLARKLPRELWRNLPDEFLRRLPRNLPRNQPLKLRRKYFLERISTQDVYADFHAILRAISRRILTEVPG